MKCDTYTQKAFGALMRAMSRPGTVQQLDLREGDAPYMPILLTLLDNEVTYAIAGGDFCGDEITLVTGSRETSVDGADFILTAGSKPAGAAGKAKRGDLRYPDKGATLIYVVKSLSGNEGTKIKLVGPGIAGERVVAIEGLSAEIVKEIRAANTEFPLGIDCILVDSEARVSCIPRTTRTEVV